jgi:hypothetical protein
MQKGKVNKRIIAKRICITAAVFSTGVLLMPLALYIPPAGNWAGSMAVRYAGKAMGLEMRVQRVNIAFPLRLSLSGLTAALPGGDTLLSLESLRLHILPALLLKSALFADTVTINKLRISSGSFIDGMNIDGCLDSFSAKAVVNLPGERAHIYNVVLSDADVSLRIDSLEETADTVPLNWHIDVAAAAVRRTSFMMSIPSDSLSLSAYIGDGAVRDVSVALPVSRYAASGLILSDAAIAYSSSNAPDFGATDPNSIYVSKIFASADSIVYSEKEMRAKINSLTASERSGFRIASLTGRLEGDSVQLDIPNLQLTTPASRLNIRATVPWSALGERPSGSMLVSIAASLGKGDLYLLKPALPEGFITGSPEAATSLSAMIEGNLGSINLSRLNITLPDALKLTATGRASDITDSLRRSMQMKFEAYAGEMNFALHFLPDEQRQSFHIPEGISLSGEAILKGGEYNASALMSQNDARIELKARYNVADETYGLTLTVDSLRPDDFMPGDSLIWLAASLKAEGKGMDLFADSARSVLEGRIKDVRYGSLRMEDVYMSGSLANHQAQLVIKSQRPYADAGITFDGSLYPGKLAGMLIAEADSINLQRLNITDSSFSTSFQLFAEIESDLNKTHRADLTLGNWQIDMPERSVSPKTLTLHAETGTDTMQLSFHAGDLGILLAAQAGMDALSDKFTGIARGIDRQMRRDSSVNIAALRPLFPDMSLSIHAEKDNPVYNILMEHEVNFDRFDLKASSSPRDGLLMDASLYTLNIDTFRIDTIRASLRPVTFNPDTIRAALRRGAFNIDTAANTFRQDRAGRQRRAYALRRDTSGTDTVRSALRLYMEGLQYEAEVIKNAYRRQQPFTAGMHGHAGYRYADAEFQYVNNRGETGLHIGLRGTHERDGLRLRLFPENPVIAFNTFVLNADNYIRFKNAKDIEADVLFAGEGNSSLWIHSVDEGGKLPELHAELNSIDMNVVSSGFAGMPQMEGTMSADVRYAPSEESFMIAGGINVDSLKYDGGEVGELMFNTVYLPLDDQTHQIDAHLYHNRAGALTATATYEADKGGLAGSLSVDSLPMSALTPFIPDHMASLGGRLNGRMDISGTASEPVINGYIQADTGSVYTSMLASRFRIDDKRLEIKNNKALFDDFRLYAAGQNPLRLNGEVNFAGADGAMADLRMQGSDLKLLDVRRNDESLVYGRLSVDVNATIRGPLETISVRGDVKLLGGTNVTYVMKESPLTVQDRLKDLVTFTSFADTTLRRRRTGIALSGMPAGGMDMLMLIRIDPSVRLRADLTPDQSSFVDLEGGGDLSFQYTRQGEMRLSGRYTLSDGNLKYALPVIPLKEFRIKDESYIQWDGDAMNPILGIAATQRMRTSVSLTGESPRMVNFDVGIDVKQRLDNMSLLFTIASPEDISVQDELDKMGPEGRSTQAVAMMATGMYLAGGSAGKVNLDMGSALSSFLQNEISNIAGDALKTTDFSFGVDTYDQDADMGGGQRTDYSFRFARRFYNDRLRVVIGGKVSTGDVQQNESFIDNASLEWRLNKAGTGYLRMFHDKNYKSILDGEVTETGLGVVLRRRMLYLYELFK